MSKYIISARAEHDAWAIYLYLEKENPAAAQRVADAFIESFRVLARNPGLGSEKNFRRHKGLRSKVISQFRSYIVFYRPLADGSGVEILRVMHGARDIEAEFER